MITFIFETLSFLLFIITCLYLPGKLISTKLGIKLTSPHDIFFSTSFGLMVFTLVAYILSWLKMELVLFPFFLILDYLAIRTKQWKPLPLEKKHRKPLLLVGFLVVIFSFTMLTTGRFGDTLVIRHDDTWHLALINELKANFPPDNPGMAGIPLKGYHFFYNFVVAKISNIFLISPLSLHFHFFPLFVSFLWGLGIYSLMLAWSKKRATALWSVFLTMFGGSFAYILVLQGHPGISLSGGLSMSQPAISLYNPPFSISIVIIITALFSLFHYLKTKQNSWLIPLVLCVGLITMFKVYAGMILLGGFLVLTFFKLIKKDFIILPALLAVGLLFFTTYWLFGANAGYLIFYPWWPPHTLLQSFTWFGYDERIYTYTHQHVLRGLIMTEVYGFSLFILGNLGTRLIGILIGIFILIKLRKLPSLFSVIVAAMALAALLIPMLFIQSGKVFEIIQMTWYYLFLCSLFAAFGLSALFRLSYPKIVKLFLALFLILATLPSAYETIKDYPSNWLTPQTMTNPYFQTMSYLSKQENYNATVLEMPPPDVKADEESVKNWYEFSTPTIGAFSNKKSYLNNEFILFPGVELKPRFVFVKDVIYFSKLDKSSSEYPEQKKQIGIALREKNIHFIYSTYEIPNLKDLEAVTNIYSNKNNFIYKISPIPVK